MNILGLNRNIMAHGLPKNLWSTDGEFVEGYMLLMRPNDGKWIVQTFDPSRGPNIRGVYDTESEACEYMLETCRQFVDSEPLNERIDALNYYKLIGAID